MGCLIGSCMSFIPVFGPCYGADALLARLVWGLAGAFLGTYVIVQNLSIPLIVQPQAFGVLSLLSWTQASSALPFAGMTQF